MKRRGHERGSILLAVLFLGVKSFEYRDKLTHYWVETKSGEFIDGHLVSKNEHEIELQHEVLRRIGAKTKRPVQHVHGGPDVTAQARAPPAAARCAAARSDSPGSGDPSSAR